MQNSQSVTTFSICASAYQTFQALRVQTIKLALLLFVLPNLLLDLILRPVGQKASEGLISPAQQSGNNFVSFDVLLNLASGFFMKYMLAKLLVFLLTALAYLAIVHMAVAFITKEESLGINKSLGLGFNSLFFKGIFIFAALSLTSLERFFWGPFPIFTMLTLVAPVILIYEHKSVGNSFFRALMLRYAHPANASALSVFLTLILFGALLHFSDLFAQMLANGLMNLDETLSLSRSFWVWTIPGLSISTPYLVKNIFMSVTYGVLFVSSAFFTASLYFAVAPRLTQRL